MKPQIHPLINALRKLNFVTRFFNSFPEPGFNVKGCFFDKEFTEHIEPDAPVIAPPADIEPQTWCDPSMGNVSFI